MSKLLRILACMLPLATACTHENRIIEETSYNYLDAMGNYRFDEAAAYASEDTRTITLKFFNEVMLPNTDSNFIKRNTPATIVINETSQTSDSTAFAIFTKTTPIVTQQDTLNLIKENGEWKADVVIIVPSLFNKTQGPRKIDISTITPADSTIDGYDKTSLR